LSQAIEAGKVLGTQGVQAAVINNPFINRVDLDTIGSAVEACGGRVVTIEDHQVIGGMGTQIAHALARSGIPHRMNSLGIQGEFGQSAYVAEHLYEKHGLTAAKMVEAAVALMK
jgi:transketolase